MKKNNRSYQIIMQGLIRFNNYKKNIHPKLLDIRIRKIKYSSIKNKIFIIVQKIKKLVKEKYRNSFNFVNNLTENKIETIKYRHHVSIKCLK
jgi:hypothetical protein